MKKVLFVLILCSFTAVAFGDTPNWILDSSNNSVSLSNFRGNTTGINNLSGLPLGVVSGEVAVKTQLVGGSFTGSVTTSPNTATSVNSPTVVTVTSTSTVVKAANASRKWLQLQDTGLNEADCAVGTNTPTTTTYHFALRTGGSYSVDSTNHHTLAVQCICASGQTTTIAVLEGQ